MCRLLSYVKDVCLSAAVIQRHKNNLSSISFSYQIGSESTACKFYTTNIVSHSDLIVSRILRAMANITNCLFNVEIMRRCWKILGLNHFSKLVFSLWFCKWIGLRTLQCPLLDYCWKIVMCNPKKQSTHYLYHKNYSRQNILNIFI